jgi:hypothetical protein
MTNHFTYLNSAPMVKNMFEGEGRWMVQTFTFAIKVGGFRWPKFLA